MAITPTPLNHLVTDLYHKDLKASEVLEKKIFWLNVKATLFSTLEKVCYVALVALIGTVFAVSYNLLTLTGVGPIVMAGLIITSPLFMSLASKLAHLGQVYSALAEAETRVNLKLRQIENWSLEDVKQFFTEHSLDFDRVPLERLQSLDEKHPEKLLLPMIARFEMLNDSLNEVLKTNRELPQKLEEGFAKQASEGHKVSQADKQQLRYESQKGRWKRLESIAIPFALNAAALLHLIENPKDTKVDVVLGKDIPGLGHCVPRSWGARMFAKESPDYNDDYFVFQPKLKRKPLKFTQIEENKYNPTNLRFLLDLPNGSKVV